jgi:hypothetical protein
MANERYQINMGGRGGLDLTSPFMQSNYNPNMGQNTNYGYSGTPDYGFDNSPFGNMMREFGGSQAGGQFNSMQSADNQFDFGAGNYASLSPAQEQMDQFATTIPNNAADIGPTGMQKWLTGYTDPKTGNQTQGLASTFGNLAMGGMGVWNSMQMLDLAKDRFKYQKGFAEREYADRKASYEEQLADRASARNAAKGTSRRPAA